MADFINEDDTKFYGHVLGDIAISPHLVVSTVCVIKIFDGITAPLLFIYFSTAPCYMHGRDHRGGIWGLTGRDPLVLCIPLLDWVFRLCMIYIYIFLRAVIIRCRYRGLYMLAAASVLRMYDDCNCEALI